MKNAKLISLLTITNEMIIKMIMKIKIIKINFTSFLKTHFARDSFHRDET